MTDMRMFFDIGLRATSTSETEDSHDSVEDTPETDREAYKDQKSHARKCSDDDPRDLSSAQPSVARGGRNDGLAVSADWSNEALGRGRSRCYGRSVSRAHRRSCCVGLIGWSGGAGLDADALLARLRYITANVSALRFADRRIADTGRWRSGDQTAVNRGHGLNAGGGKDCGDDCPGLGHSLCVDTDGFILVICATDLRR